MKTSTRPFAISLAAGVLLSVATARADAPSGSGKEAFHAVLQDSIDVVRENCKLNLDVTSDFESIDMTAWTGSDAKGADGPPRRVLRMIASSCLKAIDAINSLCRHNLDKAAWQVVIAREVKGVRCQFTGHQPRRSGEGYDVWIRRNVRFSNGVLTVLMSPDMIDLGQNASVMVMAGLANKPGAPAVAKDILKTGDNGEQCNRWQDCGSGLCANGVCSSCNSKARCRTGTQCDEGVCRTHEEIRAIDARRGQPKTDQPAPAKPTAKGLARGRMCSKDKECQSGACEMQNRTRGRCK